MYQSRARKPSANVLKPAGLPAPNDIKECRVNVDETRKRSKSKYCIPKSLRYDLENALVNLCDVWFEEIKPYLVRNNVKVHVQDDETNTGSGGNNCSTLDAVKLTRNRSANPERTNCSHLDPGAASDLRLQAGARSAGCCTTRHAASRARSHKPPSPPRPPLRPPPRPPPPTLRIPPLQLSESQSNENVKKLPAKRRGKKKRRSNSPIALRNHHRIPRLCNMMGIKSDAAKLARY